MEIIQCLDLNDGQICVAMRWQWSFVESSPIFFGTHITIPPYWCDYLDLTIVDDVFWYHVFHYFGWFSCLFKVFSWFSWFSWFFIWFEFLLNHQDRCFWGSLNIIHNYFRWSQTIGLTMQCLQCIAPVSTSASEKECCNFWKWTKLVHFTREKVKTKHFHSLWGLVMINC